MAEDIFENVVKDEDMSEIAVEIRAILGSTEGLTIQDFPQKLTQIKEEVIDVSNELVDALCWRGTSTGVLIDIASSLSWR